MGDLDFFSNGWIVSIRRDHGADVKAPAERLSMLLSMQRALAAAITELADDVSEELTDRAGR